MANPYYRDSHVPWCIIGKVSWGVTIACKIPESRIEEFVTKHGFMVLIRDSEFPVPIDDAGTMPEYIPAQRNPARLPHGYGYTDDGHN